MGKMGELKERTPALLFCMKTRKTHLAGAEMMLSCFSKEQQMGTRNMHSSPIPLGLSKLAIATWRQLVVTKPGVLKHGIG